MADSTLYAWGRPLSQQDAPFISNLDHTWVTSYEVEVDPEHQPDPPDTWEPPASYWYCWGRAHKIASHALGCAQANMTAANNISPHNEKAVPDDKNHYDPSFTSGAIVYYGLDGVCHNVANEVLCATGTTTTEPIRVHDAKGYPLSSFFYGTYGLNTEMWSDLQSKYLPDVKMPGDDFEPFMKAAVPQEQQAELLDIRSRARERIGETRADAVAKGGNYYPKLAVSNLLALGEAYALLGKEVFQKLFPFTDAKDVTWIYPNTVPAEVIRSELANL